MADNSKEYHEELNNVVGEIFVEMLKKQNLLHDRDLRNIKIRRDYNRLVLNGVPKGEAIKQLSERLYYSTTGQPYRIAERSIEKIIYPNKTK